MILVGVKGSEGSVEARPVKRSEGSGQSEVRGVRSVRGQRGQEGKERPGQSVGSNSIR